MLYCGVLAAQAPHEYFDVHHQQGTCAQSPVVCTQSVTSAAIICSNLWGRWRADQGPGKGATDNQQDEHQEYFGDHQNVYAWGVLARKPCGHCPHSVLRPFQFPAGRQCQCCDFGDQEAGQTGITLTDGR